MTILAIDVGNSRMKLGIWRSRPSGGDPADLVTAVPLKGQSDLPRKIQSWLADIEASDISQVVLAGSNPAPVDCLLNFWHNTAAAILHIESYRQVPLRMGVKQPEAVGIDRLLTAVAVRSRSGLDRPVIVVDAGTATTVNLTTSDGTFLGGAILPGMRMSARALHDYTAALPLIDADSLVDDQSSQPSSLDHLSMPGANTQDAIVNGIFWGHLGSIKELISQIKIRLPDLEPTELDPVIAMTGGGGRQLASFIPNATYEDSLALIGLATLAAQDENV